MPHRALPHRGRHPVEVADQADELADVVAQSDLRARQMGIGGVPFFIFDGKTAVSGAQEPAAIVHAIEQARAGAAQ